MQPVGPSWPFLLPQSNALPSHVKISVSRQTLFEDSFQQVSLSLCGGPPLRPPPRLTLIAASLSRS